MSDIPSHWKWTTFEKIGRWTGGGTPSKRKASYWQNGNILWVSPKDMKVSEIQSTEDQITEKAIQESSAKRIPAGSVLFVTRSGILEHTLPTALTKVSVTVNQDLKALTPDGQVDPRFLLHYTRAENSSILRSCSKDGTTVASLESSQLYAYPIPLPPLPEQQRIVAKIEELFSELDTGVADLKKAQQQLQRYRQSVLQAAVEGRLSEDWRAEHDTEPADKLLEHILEERRRQWEKQYRWERYDSKDKEPPSGWKKRYKEPKGPAKADSLPGIPDGWMWTSLDALTWNDVDYRGKTPPYSESGILTISAGNVKKGQITFETRKKYVSKETYADWLTRGKPEPGDLIITTEAPVGETALFPPDDTYLLTRRVLACQTLKVENRFLQMCVSAGATRHHLDSNSRGTTVPRILKKVLFKTPLPLPPIEEQRQIVEKVDRLLSVADDAAQTVEREIKRAERLRQSILKQAFYGKLVDQSNRPGTSRKVEQALTNIAGNQIEM